jgi:predicted site-specific integrase-resolvase
MQDIYVSGSKVSKQLGVSLSSLRNWEAQGKIQAIRTCGGHKKYNLADFLEKAKNNPETSNTRYDVVYCRVSSTKQSDDLERQVEHMRAQFPGHRVITDVGSGINFKRKGLRTLLGEAQRGRVRQVVVAHRDRLCRFAFDLVEWILTQGAATLLVQNGKQDLQHEFSEDLMAIVHVFSCRFNGLRRYKRVVQANSDEEEKNEEGRGQRGQRGTKRRNTTEEDPAFPDGSTGNTVETVDGGQSLVLQPSGVCDQPAPHGEPEAKNAGQEGQAPVVRHKSAKRCL